MFAWDAISGGKNAMGVMGFGTVSVDVVLAMFVDIFVDGLLRLQDDRSTIDAQVS